MIPSQTILRLCIYFGKTCLELLFLLPLFLLLSAVAMPQFLTVSTFVLFALFVLFGYAIGLLTNRVRQTGLFLAGLPVGIAAAIWIGAISPISVLVGLLFATVLLRGFLQTRYERRFLTPSTIWIGLLLYVGGYFLCVYIPYLQGLLLALTICGLISFGSALFRLSHYNLEYITNPSKITATVSPLLLRYNRLYMTVLLLLIVGIAAIPFLLQALKSSALWTLQVVDMLLGLLLGKRSSHQTPAPQPPVKFLPHVKPKIVAVTLQTHLLEQILKYTLLIVISAIALYGLFRLARFLVRSLRTLYRLLSQEPVAAFGYTDERENIRERLLPSANKSPFRFFKRETDEHYLDLSSNEQRVRWLYRMLLRKVHAQGFPPHQALSPIETSAAILAWHSTEKQGKPNATGSEISSIPELAALYTAVRYGNELPTTKQTEHLRSSLHLNRK